jgi:ribosomal protein S18 acetylase RimI-like enzyme
MWMTRDDVHLLEELNFNAWPALTTVHYDGWLLRSTGGESRRVNSINPIAAGRIDLIQKIEAVETIYRRWGRPAVFRLTPLADDGLDDALAARGYLVEGTTFVQVAALTSRAMPAGVLIRDQIDEAWLKAAAAIRDLDKEATRVLEAQHRAISVESGWASVEHEGQVVAVGVVGIERGWAGLHGIYVANAARGQGCARRLSEALLAHASVKGARRAWLQVEQTNDPAVSLYAQLGFRTAYAYRYRARARQVAFAPVERDGGKTFGSNG